MEKEAFAIVPAKDTGLMVPAQKTNVDRPHDKGYKKDLMNPKEFLHFLKKYIGAQWTKDLKEPQLRLCDKEFIDKDYEGREADLIYEITQENGQRIYAFILQELQSTVDYTMIFRIVLYIMSTLLRYFLAVEKNVREREDFRLPTMIPIVFYNGEKPWSAVQTLQEYQQEGVRFGEYVLNLRYYLVELSKLDEEYILSTNTVIDNIMYCDKFRRKVELINALHRAYERIKKLSAQEQESFDNWVRRILSAICGENADVAEKIIEFTKKGEDDMGFQYNAIAGYEEEKREFIGQGESRMLSLVQLMIGNGEGSLISRLEDETFRRQMCRKYNIV